MKPEAPGGRRLGSCRCGLQPLRAEDLRRAGGVGTVGRGGTLVWPEERNA